MTFNSPTQIAGIWANASRTLTGFGTAITTNLNTDNAAIANATTVLFSGAINMLQLTTIVGIATANATYNFGLSNGTTFRQGTTGVLSALAMFHGASSSGESLALNNSGSVAGAYTYSAVRWIA